MDKVKYLAGVRAKAEAGDVEAMEELGESLGRSDPESLGWFERAAEAGSAQGHVSLGWAWEKGFHGASVDLAKAVAHYQRAVAAGATELGPIELRKHLKALQTRLKKLGLGVDPLDALFAEHGLTKMKDAILAVRRPSLRWVASPARTDDSPVGSAKVGGQPDLPADMPWPKRNGRALEHVASLDFDVAPRVDGVPPIAGRLVFFYDEKNLPFGDEDEGEAGWAVVHVPSGTASARTKPPRGTKTFKPSTLVPTVEQTLPTVQSHAIAQLKLTKALGKKYWDLRDAWPALDGESHRSFGHSDGMDLSPDPDDVLLLQLDSYEHGDVNWGDAGLLLFWITPEDLASARFDRVRLQLLD